MNHRHVRALRRFWWLLVIGIGVGLFVGVGMMAHVSLSIPPKVTYRSRPKYTATEMILVTSTTDPTGRTQVTGSVHAVKGQKTRNGNKTQQPTTSQPGLVAQPAPPQSSIQTLIYAANFYPHLIPSDPVMALRQKMYGTLRGAVVAKAINSVTTASGKYKPGNVPIIQLDATAARSDRAIKLATSTTTAFATWLARDQAKNHIPVNQRILISALDVPQKTVSSGGPKKALAILVVFVVLAAFAGLALVLDKIPPRVREYETEASTGLEREELAYDESANGREGQPDSSAPRPAPAGRQSRSRVHPAPAEELSAVLADEVSGTRRGDGKTTGGAPGVPSPQPE
jgi:hypothetical protein